MQIPFKSLLISLSEKSTHHQHKLAAVLVKGGAVISAHMNNNHIHAEHATLNRAWRSDIASSTMIVVRVKSNGSFGLAKPCSVCLKRLGQAGVKKVLYTNVVGDLEAMKVPPVTTKVAPTYRFVNPNYRRR